MQVALPLSTCVSRHTNHHVFEPASRRLPQLVALVEWLEFQSRPGLLIKRPPTVVSSCWSHVLSHQCLGSEYTKEAKSTLLHKGAHSGTSHRQLTYDILLAPCANDLTPCILDAHL
eukprot:704336-Pelagomonas_calceolata.AAC.4